MLKAADKPDSIIFFFTFGLPILRIVISKAFIIFNATYSWKTRQSLKENIRSGISKLKSNLEYFRSVSFLLFKTKITINRRWNYQYQIVNNLKFAWTNLCTKNVNKYIYKIHLQNNIIVEIWIYITYVVTHLVSFWTIKLNHATSMPFLPWHSVHEINAISPMLVGTVSMILTPFFPWDSVHDFNAISSKCPWF